MDKNIKIFGAKQNNLKNLNVEFETGKITVVTGVSGSGKSSLVFDTLYAEGQRRYVETFSPYARQFLDRMDRPQVDRIEGVPPAIAIDQTNPVRTSRSTVGTMTEINDHLKLFFAREAKLYCSRCGKLVQADTPLSVYKALSLWTKELNDPRFYILFDVPTPATMTAEEVTAGLAAQGFTKIYGEKDHNGTRILEVVADRFRFSKADKPRVIEALENAFKFGKGELTVAAQMGNDEEVRRRFSNRLSCADCGIEYQKPTDATFSFNSPLGACETCRGFGRVIGVDYSLVIPDESLTLEGGAIKPWNTKTNAECLKDMKRYAKRDGIRLDVPYRELTQKEKDWVINGEPGWSGKWTRQWYGVKHFFEWLESKAYKMHVRVLLSRYRNYQECPDCHGEGQVIADPCPACKGSGRIRTTATVEVKIPAGINDGQRVRLAGRGEPGINGGPAGDLYVEIRLKPHEIFSRDGDDLHAELPISFVTAALGGTVEVPTLDGKTQVTIPEGTQNGKTFRLRDKGIANLRTKEPGDLFLHVQIETPVNLSSKQKQLLRDFEVSLKDGGTKHNPKTQSFFDRMKSFFG